MSARVGKSRIHPVTPLRRFIAEKGVTMRTLAMVCERDVRNVYLWVQGFRLPTLRNVIGIAKATGTTTDHIIELLRQGGHDL